MDHFIDLRLLPEPEIPSHQLLSALFARLHRALVRLQREDIGISFPGHDPKQPALGSHARLHGPESAMDALMGTAWLSGFHDHVQLSPIARIPDDAAHRRVRRVQAKSSPERLRRRAMRRHGLDADLALQRIPDEAAKALRLPFVTIGSHSTAQPSFPLFIEHGPLLAAPIQGSFNTYGLSKEATIPWF